MFVTAKKWKFIFDPIDHIDLVALYSETQTQHPIHMQTIQRKKRVSLKIVYFMRFSGLGSFIKLFAAFSCYFDDMREYMWHDENLQTNTEIHT